VTRYAGVIGYPAKQSLSAVFQQAAFDHLGLDMRYEIWATPEERLAEVVEGLRAPDRLGANVTIPHKEAVLPLMDERDELVRRIGAVNTIVNRDGRLHGHNTTPAASCAPSEDGAPHSPAGAAPARRRARAIVVACQAAPPA
jgi:shikimate dehydrogenase